MSPNLLSSAPAKQLSHLLLSLCGMSGVLLLSFICASVTALKCTVSGEGPEALSPSLAPSAHGEIYAVMGLGLSCM